MSDTKQIIKISEAPQNPAKVARIAGENETAVVECCSKIIGLNTN